VVGLEIVGILCALAATVFGAQCAAVGGAAAKRKSIVLALAGFAAAAAAFGPSSFAPPAVVGIAVAAAAGFALARPAVVPPMALAAGVLAGCWVSILRALGLPFAAAALVAAVLPVTACWLAGRQRGFAPPSLREEAALFVGVLGVATAAGPQLLEGWRAALAFKAQPLEGATIMWSGWLLAFVLACIACGGLWSVWKRR
jgi:hypothetical protein